MRSVTGTTRFEILSKECEIEDTLLILKRELEFERLEKETLHETVFEVKQLEKETSEKLKATSKENRSLKTTLASHSTIMEERTFFKVNEYRLFVSFFSKAECERLKTEITVLKDHLKAVKAESSSRYQALLAAQTTSLNESCASANASLESERRAKAQLEAKIDALKTALQRKDNIITSSSIAKVVLSGKFLQRSKKKNDRD